MTCSGGGNCFNTRQRLSYTSVCNNCKVTVPTTTRKTYLCAVCFHFLDPNVDGQWQCIGRACAEHYDAALRLGAGPCALGKAAASDNRPASGHAAASGNAAASDRPPPPRLGNMVVARIRQRRRIGQWRCIGTPARRSLRPDRSFGKRGGPVEASPKLVGGVAWPGNVA